MIPLPEIASAWVTLVVSAKGMESDVRREVNKLDGVMQPVGRKMGRELEAGVGDGAKGAANQVRGTLSQQLGTQVGTVLGRGIGGALHGSITVAAKAGELALKGALVGAAGVASVAVGGIGLALSKGFDRLKAIDDAKFKLKALGNDAAAVSKIMDSALASVKGTAFSLGEAADTAASAVAAGVAPGQGLTKYLSDVADLAAVSQRPLSDVGAIFNKIQTTNKTYLEDLQQLPQIPIFKWLQKEYGVTADKLTDMVSKGEVDAAHFQRAIETNIGGAALKMGDSFSGSVANAEAALGRLGAAFLAPVFGNAAGGIGSITTGLDNLTTWVSDHQPEIINFFTDMGIAAVSVAQQVVKAFGDILGGVGDLSHGLGTFLNAVGGDGSGLQAVGDNLNAVGVKMINTATGSGNAFDIAKDKIRAWGDQAATSAEYAQNAVGGAVKGIGTQVGALPFKKIISIEAQTADAESKLHTVGNSIKDLPFKKTVEVEIHGTTTGTATPLFAPWLGLKDPDHPLIGHQNDGPTLTPNNNGIPTLHKASGGSVFGAGSATSDSIPAMLSSGEHVWTADEVAKAGGQSAMYRMRAAVRGFAGGGRVPLPLMDPRGLDPHGGKDAGAGLGAFAPWWDMDWEPPEHPWGIGDSIAGVEGKWWHRGPNRGGQSGWRAAPPLGKYRKPLPGQQLPPWLQNRENAQGFAGGGAVGGGVNYNTGGSLTPNAVQLKQLLGQAFPEITDIGGWRPPDGYNEHSSGQALDLMIPNPNSPEGKALGNELNQWLLKNADSLGIQYDLWQQTQWNPNGTTSGMENRGSPTANHMDHVHVRVKPGEATGATLTQAFADSMGVGAKDAADKLANDKSSKGGSGGFDASSLGSSLLGGFMQSLGLDGSVFSDPLEWPNVKSGMALANYGLGFLGGGSDGASSPAGGAFSGLGLPNLANVLSPSGPQALSVDPNSTVQHGAGMGAPPGPTVNYNMTAVDTRAGFQQADAHANQSYRRNLSAVRP